MGTGSGEEFPCCESGSVAGSVAGVVGTVSAGLVMKGSKRSLGAVVGISNGCDSTPVESSAGFSGEVVKGSRLLLGGADGQGDGSEFEGG